MQVLIFFYHLYFETVRGRQRQREIFHLLVNSQMATRPQLGEAEARNLTQISHVGCKDPDTRAIFNCFLRLISKQLDGKWISWGLNKCPYRMLALQVATSLATAKFKPYIHLSNMTWCVYVQSKQFYPNHPSLNRNSRKMFSY